MSGEVRINQQDVRRPKPGRGPRRSRPRGLKALFVGGVPARESAMWSLLDEEGRKRAMKRGLALLRWDDGAGDVTAKRAAEDADVSLTRFYQMAALWREGRSLAALGVGAAPDRPRRSQFKPEVNAVLQKAVVDVVGQEDDASVRRLALRLAQVAREKGLAPDDVPAHNTLRSMVERELRRRQRKREVGNGLLLDHSPCGVLRADGSPWTLFAVVDAASQLILGAAPGDAAASIAGYRDAARDALRRIADESFTKLAWSDRLAGVQIVPGDDGGESFGDILTGGSRIGVGVNLTADRKAGRYLEEHIGRAIGTLPVWPFRASSTSLPPWADQRAPRLDAVAAHGRIHLAVDDHDAALLPDMAGRDVREPPGQLLELLNLIAR